MDRLLNGLYAFISIIAWASIPIFFFFLVIVTISKDFKKLIKICATFICFIVVCFILYIAIPTFRDTHKRHSDDESHKEYEQFIKAEESYFSERCKSAKTAIYNEKIPIQDSFLIMNPVSSAEYPKGYEDSPIHIQSDTDLQELLQKNPKETLSFDNDYQNFPYLELTSDIYANIQNPIRIENGKNPQDSKRPQLYKANIDNITSRYGLVWEDITTPEDLKHSVLGGKKQIIELATNKVVAEIINYKLVNKKFKNYLSKENEKVKWRSCQYTGEFPKFIYTVLRKDVGNSIKDNEKEKYNIFVEKVRSAFKSRCQNAGIFIYEDNIPPQKSVFIMRPISPDNEDYKKYNETLIPSNVDNRSFAFLKRTHGNNAEGQGSGFNYIELAFDPETANKNPIRIENVMSTDGLRFYDKKTNISKITSRYGVTWEDITTPEDNENSILGGKRQIIELATQKVVAEIVNYQIINKYLTKNNNDLYKPCFSKDDEMERPKTNSFDRLRSDPLGSNLNLSEELLFKVLKVKTYRKK